MKQLAQRLEGPFNLNHAWLFRRLNGDESENSLGPAKEGLGADCVNEENDIEKGGWTQFDCTEC